MGNHRNVRLGDPRNRRGDGEIERIFAHGFKRRYEFRRVIVVDRDLSRLGSNRGGVNEPNADRTGLPRLDRLKGNIKHLILGRRPDTVHPQLTGAVIANGKRPGRARLRYAGDSQALEGMFVPRVLRASLPSEAVAGSTSRLRLQLQNMSHFLWRSEGVLAVMVGYRIVPEAAGAQALDGRRGPLPKNVASGEVFQAHVDVAWPEEPGAYRLMVDLWVEGVGWFAERVGRPLAQATVEVIAPADDL